ncbi:MAG: tRNA 2-thiocytidine(32) synthetase TtcA [Spirochaetia bacterium]|nr:tRNA 2-thiocytidine(32) synthetase TtcA [Spirochaetia bacterium]
MNNIELSLADQIPLNKLSKKILRLVGKAIATYQMIEEGDRIMLAVSGGKDSLFMLHILKIFQKKAPVNFEIFAYTLDQGQPNYDSKSLETFYKKMDIEYYIEYSDTYSVVTDKIEEGKTYCSLCSRLRRGILYSEAERLNATKIALGHHSDDAIETLFLNLFYSGRMAAISPKLKSDDNKHIVIRPLILLAEEDITRMAEYLNLPIMPCNLCNNQDNLQRQRIKNLIKEESKINPVLRTSLRSALQKLEPRHLWDISKMDFENLNTKSEFLLK